jgi:hypothetical protein
MVADQPREKLVWTGANIVGRIRYPVFLVDEVSMPTEPFKENLTVDRRMRPRSAPV